MGNFYPKITHKFTPLNVSDLLYFDPGDINGHANSLENTSESGERQKKWLVQHRFRCEFSRTSDFSQKKFGCHANVTPDLQRKYKMNDMAEGYLAINGNGIGNASKIGTEKINFQKIFFGSQYVICSTSSISKKYF